MKSSQRNPRLVAVAALASALLVPSCETTPGQSAAAWGGLAGAAMTGYRLAQGDSTGDALLKGAAVGAAVGATVFIVAKRKATARQIADVERRIPVITEQNRSQPSRYLAVETEIDDRTQGETTVMIYDTTTHQLVSNDVYDLKNAPANGAVATFESYDAVFVAKN